MTDPAQHSAAADPEARRDDQPEDASPECAIVDLADTGNEEAQNRGRSWFAHNVIPPSQRSYDIGRENILRFFTDYSGRACARAARLRAVL